MLHFSLYEVGSGACGEPSTGGPLGDPEFGVPAAAGGHTTDIRAADPCVSWLGGNQPRLSEPSTFPVRPLGVRRGQRRAGAVHAGRIGRGRHPGRVGRARRG